MKTENLIYDLIGKCKSAADLGCSARRLIKENKSLTDDERDTVNDALKDERNAWNELLDCLLGEIYDNVDEGDPNLSPKAIDYEFNLKFENQ